MQPSHLIAIKGGVWNVALTCIQSNNSLQGLCGRWQCSDKYILYNGKKFFHLLPLFGFLTQEIRTWKLWWKPDYPVLSYQNIWNAILTLDRENCKKLRKYLEIKTALVSKEQMLLSDRGQSLQGYLKALIQWHDMQAKMSWNNRKR